MSGDKDDWSSGSTIVGAQIAGEKKKKKERDESQFMEALSQPLETGPLHFRFTAGGPAASVTPVSDAHTPAGT